MGYVIPQIEIIESVEKDVVTVSVGTETGGDDYGVGWGPGSN